MCGHGVSSLARKSLGVEDRGELMRGGCLPGRVRGVWEIGTGESGR